MDWITGIQRAIDYIEDNLTEELDYEEIAKLAYVSNFHFQRVFVVFLVIRSVNISGTDGSRLPAASLPHPI